MYNEFADEINEIFFSPLPKKVFTRKSSEVGKQISAENVR